MFCRNCGKVLRDDASFCPECGARVSNEREAQNMTNTTFAYNGQYASANQMIRLQTDRSLVMYILLTIVTCGIYGFYFFYKMAHDINIACQDDGENTPGLAVYILLSIITCGIYQIIWAYKFGNRLAANAYRYGYSFQENGTTILMWMLFGTLLCGVGPFIAMHIMIKNTNLICQGYNRMYNL